MQNLPQIMAGLKSYQIFAASGVAADHLVMSQLAGPVAANTYYLLIAGLIMVATLFLSKKAKTVTETEVNLARQDSGAERFGSSQFSRTLVRQTMQSIIRTSYSGTGKDLRGYGNTNDFTYMRLAS